MMQIRYLDVPQWLQNSDFYRSLSEDEPNSYLEVPQECFRANDDDVHTLEDLAAILKVVRFWGLTCIPQSVLEFCCCNDALLWDPVVAEIIGEGIQEHKVLKIAFEDSQKFSLEVALKLNRPEFVSFWLSKFDASGIHAESAVAQACRFGRLDLVQTLREKGFPWDVYAHCAAAQYGHLVCLQYLHEKECPCDEKALIFAARGGQLKCMKYLHTLGCPWHEDVTMEYAVSAHYKLLDGLCGKPSWSDDWSIPFPVNGYLECLRYTVANGCPIHECATAVACEYGLLDCLHLLQRHGAKWDPQCTDAAASQGYVDCLSYAHENGCVLFEFDMATAAAKGHLNCVQFLRENGCSWDETVTWSAARAGQLECLKYLHENGCPWEMCSALAAAEGNHLTCLQYLHENHCPWNGVVVDAAAKRGHLECLRYIMENGHDYFRLAALLPAITYGHLDCVRYLIEEKKIEPDITSFAFAFKAGRFPIVQYLIDTGCPFRDYEFVKSKRAEPRITTCNDGEFLKCIQYAMEHGWQYNSDLLALIEEQDLSLCQAYVRENGWKGKF